MNRNGFVPATEVPIPHVSGWSLSRRAMAQSRISLRATFAVPPFGGA